MCHKTSLVWLSVRRNVIYCCVFFRRKSPLDLLYALRFAQYEHMIIRLQNGPAVGDEKLAAFFLYERNQDAMRKL